MRCPTCGFDNPDGFKFCGECGTRLRNKCPSCGFDNPPNFKFCGECGAKLTQSRSDRIPSGTDTEDKVPGIKHSEIDMKTSTPERGSPETVLETSGTERREKEREQPVEDHRRTEQKGEKSREAERRPVSVLFADISGFTSLSEKLDPEELRTFIGNILNDLADIVRRNGGYVDKFIGDEIMALFGAPQAMGDDTKRAIRAACEMREFIRNNFSEISIHGGIATGEVVVGSISERPQDYTAMGDTVNIAKRLEEESEPWQFLVDENTFVITSKYCEYRYFGEIKLKGKTKNLRVYELVGEKPSIHAFVGREREFAEIVEILTSGRGFVGIYGEPGVGVSSFIEHIHTSLKNSHKVIASDRGFYGTVKDIIASVLRLPENKEEQILKISQKYSLSPHFLGYIFGVIFPESPLRYMSPNQIERETFNTLLDFMNAIFDGKVLIIDSFSDADRYSSRFFMELPNRTTTFSVIVGFDKGALDTNQFPNGWKLIELSNFDLSESRRFLEYLAGENFKLDELFVQMIYITTGGNPLFMMELFDLLKAQGYLQLSDGVLKLKEGATFPKALGIKQVILSKIDKLPASAIHVLEVLSCMNVQHKKVLYKYFEGDLRSFSKALEILKQNAFIEEEEDLILFRQQIYKDVVYDKLLRTKRYEIHSKLFESAVAVSDDDVDIISIAAEQAEKSDRLSEAFEMYRRASNIAKSRLNVAQAIFFSENAYRIIDAIKDHHPAGSIYEFFMDFGTLMYDTSEFQRAKQLFENAEKFAENEPQFIRARIKTADCLQMLGEFDEAEKIYRDTLRVSENREHLKTEHIKTLALLCHLFVDKGEPHKGIEFGTRALSICDNSFKEVHREVYSDIINAMGRTYLTMGEIHKAKRFFMEFYEQSLKIDNQRVKGVAMVNYAVALYFTGDLESALLLFKQYHELTEKIMDTRGSAVALINIAHVLFEIGRVNEAIEKANNALEIFKKIGDKYGQSESLEFIATMKILLGEYEEGRRIVLEFLIPNTESDIRRARYYLLVSMAYVGEKKSKEAENYLGKSLALNPSIQNDIYFLFVSSRLRLFKGDFETAYDMARRAIHLAQRDTQKLFSILNFKKVTASYDVDSVILKEEKERLEREFRDIAKRFPDFSPELFVFFG